MSGNKEDIGKLRYDLVPPEAFEELVKCYTIGANKYQNWNWAKGLVWSRVYAALMRHLEAWRKGEDCDPEDGQFHLASVAWNAMTLLQYSLKRQEFLDDRPAWLYEEWVPVKNWEKYEISDCGRVRKNGILLKPSIDKSHGYVRIGLWKEGKHKIKYIHRLVAEAFLGDIPENCQINHRDGKRGNNHWTNLEFIDASGNIFDSWRRGSRQIPTTPLGKKDLEENA